jgi:nucleotide-binding universal stress UspA family protein
MSAGAVLLGWAVVVIASMLVASYLARRWGRDPFGWALLSAALGPIALVALAGTRQADLIRPEPFERRADGRGGAGERVLLAVDGSAVGGRLARHMVDLHRADVAPMLLVVLPHEDFERGGAASKAEHDAKIDAATADAMVILRTAGLAPSVIVGYGSPGEEIVRCADEQRAAAIVVGRRGAGLSRALLGSVSDYVVRHAKQPVAIVE